MTATMPDQPGEFVSERVVGGMLPRVLNTFDMVAIFVSIVLFITNAAVIQSAGPAAFGWRMIGFLAFLGEPGLAETIGGVGFEVQRGDVVEHQGRGP